MRLLSTTLATLVAGASAVSGATIYSQKESYDVTNFFDKFTFYEVLNPFHEYLSLGDVLT